MDASPHPLRNARRGRAHSQDYENARASLAARIERVNARYDTIDRELSALAWLSLEMTSWSPNDVAAVEQDLNEAREDRFMLLFTIKQEQASLGTLSPDPNFANNEPETAARTLAQMQRFAGLVDVVEISGKWRALPAR